MRKSLKQRLHDEFGPKCDTYEPGCPACLVHEAIQAGQKEDRKRICKDLDEMWSALYGAYLNNQDLRELIKNVVTTPPTSEEALQNNK